MNKFFILLSLQKRRNFFGVSFVMSIVWIAGFSFLMNWWASVIGEAIGIPEDVSSYVMYVKNES